MSKVQVDKVVNLSDDGAPQLTYGAELPVGYGLTGAGGLNITGVVTAASAVFSGNVTIGGTLTYEDVTNIDVVGVSTFAGRMNVNSSALFNEGLRVTAGVTTISGTSTFSDDVTFTGAAANLTWDKSTDDLIFNDNAKAIFGTSSSGLEIYHDGSHSRINSTDGAEGRLIISGRDGSADAIGLQLNAEDSKEAIICKVDSSVDIYYNASKKFETTNDGTVTTGIGTFTGNVNIAHGTGQAHYQITQTSGNTVKFGIVSGSDIELSGSSNNSMIFKTNNSERIRIDGSGAILQGKTATKGSTGENVPTFCNEIASDNPNVLEIANNGTNGNSYSALVLSRSDATSVNGHTAVDSGDQIGELCFIGADGADRFNTAAAIKTFANSNFSANNCPAYLSFFTNAGSASATERLRITSSGTVNIGGQTTQTAHSLSVNKSDGNCIQVGNTSGSSAGSHDAQIVASDGTNFNNLKLGGHETKVFANVSGGTGYAETWRFDSSGNLACKLAGKGIDFSAQTASSTATTAGELLDHYEYGTWTPTIEGQSSAGTATYPQRRGDYTKIGNRVFVNCYISYNSGSGSGNLLVAGLPFNVKNVSACDHVGGIMMSNITINNADDVCSVVAYTGNNLTKVFFYTTRSGTTYTTLSYDDSGEIIFSLSYNTK